MGEEQLKKAYARMDDVGGGQVALSQFLDACRSHFICTTVVSITDSLAQEGRNPVRDLEVNEQVEGLEEPVVDETSGAVRVRVRADRDQAEGYVDMADEEGTRTLEPYSAYDACLRKMNA